MFVYVCVCLYLEEIENANDPILQKKTEKYSHKDDDELATAIRNDAIFVCSQSRLR